MQGGPRIKILQALREFWGYRGTVLAFAERDDAVTLLLELGILLTKRLALGRGFGLGFCAHPRAQVLRETAQQPARGRRDRVRRQLGVEALGEQAAAEYLRRS